MTPQRKVSRQGRVPSRVRGEEGSLMGQHQPKAGSSVPGGGGNVGSGPAGRGKMSAQRTQDRCQHGLAWAITPSGGRALDLG